ncbi:hypothetical protein [Paenibacillus oryzisoli]|uniref:Uncharacterized protein n=1 Tax=Paenibacillus oryzisoli TaxID=1850517 RepID=A0A198ACP0_9BACL|nr:hypothetical protein [Paenibacillus oryzisoli]OAS19264.1 hypothetical protein A8708_26505 [Paenibacillus oryzisoli]
MTSYWTPEIGRKNQSLLIKMMRDKQKKPKCQICNDEEWVEQGSGALLGYVECMCQENKESGDEK